VSAEDTARKVIAKVGLWWPAADEGKLDAAAAAWDAFAADIDAAAVDGTAAARSVVAANTGGAIEAFGSFWAKYDGGSDAYLPATAAAARSLAEACRKYAGAVRDAKHRVEELAVEIGATLVAGAALAFFTFGATEAAAAGISAELIAAAEAIGVELSATAASIIGSAVAFGAVGGLEAAAVDIVVAQPIRVEGFHDGGYSFDEVTSSAESGSILGGLAGGGGAAFRAMRGLDGVPVTPAEAPTTGIQDVLAGEPAAPPVAGAATGGADVFPSGGLTALDDAGAGAAAPPTGPLTPSSTFTRNGYEFTSDAQGRLSGARGSLYDQPGPRNATAAADARALGNTGDHAGHMIAARFDGPSDLTNLVPQHAKLNQGAWKAMENEWARSLKAGDSVDVQITPNYTGSSTRPSSFDVSYKVGDEWATRYFRNEAP